MNAMRKLVLAAVLLAMVCALSQVSRLAAAQAPQIDEVPAPLLTGKLPLAASWPTLRDEQPLRLLVLTTKGNFLSPYQAIARRLHGTVEARYINGSDARYHVNDKWIEPNDPPTAAELTGYAKQVIIDTLRGLLKKPRFDVVFIEEKTRLLTDPDVTLPLLDYLRDGGVVVVVGNYFPDAANALATIWPAKASAKGNSLHAGGSKRSEGPELAGVPTDRLTGWNWIPFADAANGGRELASGESGALYASTVGKGKLLFCPTGPMSRTYNARETVVREYDHDEVWLRYWDQALHEVCAGSRAFPAYADKFETKFQQAEDKNQATIEVAGVLVNRSARGTLAGSVHVVNPLGAVIYQAEVPVLAAVGASQELAVSVPVAPFWGAGIYRVYFTLADATAKKQLHQALGFVAVPGTVKLLVASNKPGYAPGEMAQFTVTSSSPQPWNGKLLLAIYDFRGRLLERKEQVLNLTAETNTSSFLWRVQDEGVRVDTYQVVVSAVQAGVEWARAENRVDKSVHWNMRNEYQWSPWSGLTCLNPSTVLPAMRLLGHAGFNSLGYPGRSGLAYAAERWGWRYYSEGIGINTFSPRIEYENDAEIAAQVRKEAQGKAGRDMTSPAYVLASVGEEAGFNVGLGTTYYWDTPVAPEKACHAFQWYLQTRYPDLARLNATWRSNFKSWDEVKLTKEFSSSADKYLEADGWAHPKQSPLGEGTDAVSLAPFSDTQNFYAWYYDRFIAAAKLVYREQTNPVSLTISSAPASWIFDSRECDVATAGPSGWNESQTHALGGKDDPTFALVWGHFDWLMKDEDLFWGFLLQRTGHNDYWWDSLMFNGDLTHTRSTMALRRWTTKFAGREPAILDSRLLTADVGILAPNGLISGRDLGNMQSSLAVSLMQGGFSARSAKPDELAPYKLVFAVGHQALSADEAAKLQAYVNNGGTLVFTPRFGSQDEFGGPQAICPGQGLAEKWGLTVDAKLAKRGLPKSESQFALDALAPELKGLLVSDSTPYTSGGFREAVMTAQGWTTLAAYPDGTPGLLTRSLGKGKLVYLNALYTSHRYIQFRTPTDAPRQGFFKLTEWLCQQAKARQTLQIKGDLEQVLHTAVKQFTDTTGNIQYVILKNSIDAPWVNGRLQWLGNGTAVYDVFTGDRYGTTVPFQFRPNQGRWLAILEQPVKRIEVTATPALAGEPVKVSVRIVGENGKVLAGQFPLTVTVSVAGQEIAGLRRSLSLASGGEVVLPTALNDPAGKWTITVTDGITRLSGQASLLMKAAPTAETPAMRPLGWPSEVAPPQQLDSAEFIDRLQRLSELYQTDQTQEGNKLWLTKQNLGSYYDWFPGSRHDLLRPLYDVDWQAYVPVWRAALANGATFVLTGEDMGVDPGSGLTIYPHADAHQFAALTQLLRDAKWQLGTSDGDTVIATLGKGRLILSRESIDAAGHTNQDAARWQQRWRAELAATAAGKPQPIVAPTESTLRDWWRGEALTRELRIVSWFGGNQREIKLLLDPNKPLDSVVTLILPPTGKVTSVELAILVTGKTPDPVTFDVGCDDTVDATVNPATEVVVGSTLLDWPTVINRYLATCDLQGGPVRDEQGCRLLPVRLRGIANAEVTLSGLRIVIQ